MIAYEELVAALTNWRARQGLPTGAADYLGEPPRATYTPDYQVAGEDVAEVHEISELDEIHEISEYEVADAEASASGEIGGEPYADSAAGDDDYYESELGGFTADAYAADDDTFGAPDPGADVAVDAGEASYIADAPITEPVAAVADPGLEGDPMATGDSLAELGDDEATMIGEAPGGAAPPPMEAMPSESPFDDISDAGVHADQGLPPPPPVGGFDEDDEVATHIADDPAEDHIAPEPDEVIDAGELGAGPPPLAPPPDGDGDGGTVDIDEGDVVDEATAINDPYEPR